MCGVERGLDKYVEYNNLVRPCASIIGWLCLRSWRSESRSTA